jgi:flagellum-specific peptidoglycan hydrolase FlgJ
MQTDDKQPTKIESGNAKPGSAQTTPPISNNLSRVSTDSRQSAKVAVADSQAHGAQMAPQPSHGASRVSANSPYLTPQQLQFLLRVAPPALESQRQQEIPACVTIAQAILESATAAGWGSSSLFRLANNPFGIKYEHFGTRDREIGRSGDREIGRSGDRVSNQENPSPDRPMNGSTPSPTLADQVKAHTQVTGSLAHPIAGSPDRPIACSPDRPITGSSDHPLPDPYGAFDAQTWEIVHGQKQVVMAQFQRFPNLTEAFIAHAQLLRGPRYRPAFAVRHDWKQFAERLGPKTSPLDSEHCGYSTNPSYSAEIIKLVALYRLDDPRALQWFATGKDPGHRAIESSGHRVIEPSAHLAIEASSH